MPSAENDETRGEGEEFEEEKREGGDERAEDAEAAKLTHEIQKLNALQYLLDEDAFEELNQDVSTMRAEVAMEDNSLSGLVRRRKSSINLRLKEFQEALRGNKLVNGGRKLKALVDDKKLRKLISSKKKQLDEILLQPRFIDRCAFFIGILVVCITEFMILRCPDLIYVWYTFLIFPLMAIRFFMYHKMKFHYFMLDFCYLCQFLLLFFLFAHSYILNYSTPGLFKLVFSLSNGPLAWGTIVWRNKLVFHDVDKLTSVFIHLCPPLVTYCLRWHTPFPHHPNPPPQTYADGASSFSLYDALVNPIVIYVFWQVSYFVKTEIVDRKKLKNDKEIMTSSRWMTVKEPHPIYKWSVAHGYRGDGVILLMGVQLVYTALTLISLPLLYNFFWLHSGFLVFVFCSVLWEGASYYFEVFTDAYQKRLERAKTPLASRQLQSLVSSVLFFTFFLGSLMGLLKLIL